MAGTKHRLSEGVGAGGMAEVAGARGEGREALRAPSRRAAREQAPRVLVMWAAVLLPGRVTGALLLDRDTNLSSRPDGSTVDFFVKEAPQ